MKFHVLRDDDGKPVDFQITVSSPVNKGKYNGPATCKCSMVYPVVMKSLRREHVVQGARHDGRKFVCECHGNLVP